MVGGSTMYDEEMEFYDEEDDVEDEEDFAQSESQYLKNIGFDAHSLNNM